MGSSKKHKEKDKEHKRKKHRRSRSRSKSRERKSRRHHSPENPERYREGRDREGRDRERERHGGPSGSGDVDDYAPPPQIPVPREAPESVDGKEKLSLSVDETNKLRAKLGLKPLDVSESTDGDGKPKENQDVHVPAINLAEKRRTEKIREKMKVIADKRKVSNKLRRVKGLGDSDSDEGHGHSGGRGGSSGAMAWVKKSRKQQQDKELADKRAKMLEEMDAEFGVGSLVDQDMAGQKKSYSSRDLSGLKVEHHMEKFKEGSRVILTLKDKGVLDEEDDDGDVLVNVNIQDDERAQKNIDNKKKGADYKPYDEPEMDEYGMMKSNDVLDKYDEEIHGEKRESFTLGSGGKYDAEHERNMYIIRQELRRQGQSLAGPGLKLASEFMTPEEMAGKKTKFKKVRKKVRKIRKKEKEVVLKADDLQPLVDQRAEPTDYGSRSRGRGVNDREVEEDEEGEGGEDEGMEMMEGIQMREGEDIKPPPPPPPPEDDVAFYTGILPVKQEPPPPLVKEEPPGTFRPPLPRLPPPPPPSSRPPKTEEDDDLMGPDEDLSGVAVEEDAMRQELQASLNKTRRLQQRHSRMKSVQKVMEGLVKTEPEDPEDEEEGDKGANANIILNSTSEFCRSLGEIPTYGLSGNREEEREEIMDLELEAMEQRKHEQEMEEQASGWAEVDIIDTNPVNIMGEEQSVLEEEPIVTDSIGAALKLASKKGYLEGEGASKAATSSKNSHIHAQNYSIEDKRYDDLDEKYRKRDRYGGGMVTDFKDKDGYRPDIYLEYVDDSGRALNPKEAFRQLSHRFHGKGSGKKKTEKRQKKVEEENLMKQMSSTDTPLNTLSMLKTKQRSEKSPYVILSGNKTFSANSTTLSKPHH